MILSLLLGSIPVAQRPVAWCLAAHPRSGVDPERASMMLGGAHGLEDSEAGPAVLEPGV